LWLDKAPKVAAKLFSATKKQLIYFLKYGLTLQIPFDPCFAELLREMMVFYRIISDDQS
jgi:hypothetical protein